jgi:SNF2 family DNA or RNA helicase
MTAPVLETAPSGFPEGALYYSERGLYPFQLDDIARALVMRSEGRPYSMVVWDTGLGKSHFAMATSAFTLQDSGADLVILVCERVKLREWEEDFKIFTRLKPRRHHGPGRKNQVAKRGLPEVLISTYETLKADLAKFEAAKRGKKIVNGWLMDEILASGKKPMIIFDESDKLSNRTSANYKAWDYVLRTLRKEHPGTPVYMMSATPIRRDLENGFNQLRLLAPDRVPLIKEFEDYFVRGRNIYGKALYHEHRVQDFSDLVAPLLMVKSKEDPDVRDQFPKLTEEALWVDLECEQRELYDLIDGLEHKAALTLSRMVCAHPASILRSASEGTSELARLLVEQIGEDFIRSVNSAKTDRLVDYLRPVILGQGAKAVVFSFFGPSVLPLLEHALKRAGIKTWMHSEDGAIQEFRRSILPGVLLASDAASRGINLPEASYLIEYDMATTYGTRTQRLNRASRIGSGGPTLTVRSMLMRDSIEIPLMFNMLKGHQQSDSLLGRGVTGEEFLTANMRRQILLEGM